jgi:phosphate transport system permease protein
MSSVIANEFTEATEPFHLSALFVVVASWLLIIALAVNIAGKLVIRRIRTDLA